MFAYGHKIPSLSGGFAEVELIFQVRCSRSFWHRREGGYRLRLQWPRSVHILCTFPQKSRSRSQSKERGGGLRSASSHGSQAGSSTSPARERIRQNDSRRNPTCHVQRCILDRRWATPPRELRRQALPAPLGQTCPFPTGTRMHPCWQM